MGDTAELLIGIGLQGHGVLMGYQGRNALLLFEDGTLLDAKDAMPREGYPANPGLYVWRGRIVVDGGGAWDDLNIGCEGGEWSPADPGDIDNLLGVQMPPPPPPDPAEDRDSPGV